MGGATSRTVHQGLGMPGDQSENEKGSGGLARHGKGGLQESAGPAYEPGKDYVGNSRQEREYRGQGADEGSQKGNRGAGSQIWES